MAPADDDRLAVAWCALRDGAHDRALAALPASPQGVLAPYERELRAEALLAANREADAAKALAGLELPGDAGRTVRLLRARIGWKQGDPGARADLEALSKDRDVGREAAFWLASGSSAEQAQPILQALWTDARPGGWDARAAEALAKLGAPVPELASLEGRKLAFARFASLAAAFRTQEALDLLVAIRKAGGDFSAVTWARAWASARHWPEAVEAWKQALGPPESASGAPDELFDYALTTARSGDYDTAAAIYRHLIDVAPKSDQADFASFKLGYMEYDRGDCDRAVPLLEAHATAHPASSRAADALWFAARCEWRSGHVNAAVALWDQVGARKPASELAPGAAYWTARAAGKKDASAEKAGLEQVLARWPVSGWAWFAAERLGRTFPAQAAAEPPPWPSPPDAVVRARALLEQGFQAWARDELADVAPSGREATLALAWLRLSAGDYQGAKQLARPFCVSPSKGGDPVAQQACTPRPERAVVEAVASRHGMDPNLAYAIMTAESNLDPGVTSPAGARGLMQMMPDLGAELHRKLYGERPYHADDLYVAAYNASVGTEELGERTAELDHAVVPSGLPAVIASYNAGSEAVSRWTSGGSLPFDEFAEDIGYAETRVYVRRVLGFAMAYRWVYGDAG
jgi:soluble lytic murein transglycosylase-like protein